MAILLGNIGAYRDLSIENLNLYFDDPYFGYGGETLTIDSSSIIFASGDTDAGIETTYYGSFVATWDVDGKLTSLTGTVTQISILSWYHDYSDDYQYYSDGAQLSQFSENISLFQSGYTTVQISETIFAGYDYIEGTLGNDRLYGYASNDTLKGYSGADVLDGGAGEDVLIGGLGNDTYVTDGLDIIVETAGAGSGTDLVYASASYTLADNIENLTLLSTAGNAAAKGNGLANVITGNNGANVIDGLGGADRLVGNGGNDTYVTDGGDTIVEAVNGGTDLVYSSVTYTLAANLENLTLTSTAGNSAAYGNASPNIITGNNGNNVIDGKGGADRFVGNGGNDTYYTDGGDTIVEAANGGTDTVYSTVSYTLAANVENLILQGSSALNGAGNAGNNSIYGNSAANTLSGAAGNDRIVGGLGNDTLYGGADKDVFLFDTTPNSTTNRDTIMDFNVVDDFAYLENAIFTKLTATGTLNSAFFVTGTAALDGNDYIVYNKTTGALFYDSDGNGAAGAVQFASVTAGLGLTAADFYVV
jgi:Ca2+-binding RTX toxin-like protein